MIFQFPPGHAIHNVVGNNVVDHVDGDASAAGGARRADNHRHVGDLGELLQGKEDGGRLEDRAAVLPQEVQGRVDIANDFNAVLVFPFGGGRDSGRGFRSHDRQAGIVDPAVEAKVGEYRR